MNGSGVARRVKSRRLHEPRIFHLLFDYLSFGHLCFVSVRVVSWIVFPFSAHGTIHEITRSNARKSDVK